MVDIIVVSLLVVIAAAIVWYLLRAKKRGEKCIGCPHSRECSGKCNGKSNNLKGDG